MSVTLDCTSARFLRGGKLKLSSDRGDSGSNKCKRCYGVAYGGVGRSLRLVGVWSQAVGFVGAFGRKSGFSRRESFSIFILFFKKR
jgi:hypothetical protein